MEDLVLKKLLDLLELDSPANYECLGDAQESIAGEFEVDLVTHSEICERIEQWWHAEE